MAIISNWAALWQSADFPFSGAYCSLERAKAWIRLGNDKADDDEFFKAAILFASMKFSEHTNRFMLPFKQTRAVPVTYRQPRPFGDVDILGVTALSDATGAISDNAYRLLPLNAFPKTAIEFTPEWLDANPDRPAGGLTVDCLCGYHPNPATMWRGATALGAAVVSTTETEITLTGAGGIGRLDTIKIGDEFMTVTGITTGSTPKLTVLRGALGTTAAQHENAVPVSQFTVPDDVQQAVVLRASHLKYTRMNPAQSKLAGPQGTFETGIEPPQVADTEAAYARNTGGRLGRLRHGLR